MKLFLCVLTSLTLVGCSGMSSLFQSADDVLTDDVATATVYKGAMQKDTDIGVSINITNKDKLSK